MFRILYANAKQLGRYLNLRVVLVMIYKNSDYEV